MFTFAYSEKEFGLNYSGLKWKTSRQVDDIAQIKVLISQLRFQPYKLNKMHLEGHNKKKGLINTSLPPGCRPKCVNHVNHILSLSVTRCFQNPMVLWGNCIKSDHKCSRHIKNQMTQIPVRIQGAPVQIKASVIRSKLQNALLIAASSCTSLQCVCSTTSDLRCVRLVVINSSPSRSRLYIYTCLWSDTSEQTQQQDKIPSLSGLLEEGGRPLADRDRPIGPSPRDACWEMESGL